MYITITGLDRYMGVESIKPKDIFYLIKDTNNAYDDEAIKVCKDKEIIYGYVANSVYTVARGTHSAGYIYESIKGFKKCEILFIVKDVAIARII